MPALLLPYQLSGMAIDRLASGILGFLTCKMGILIPLAHEIVRIKFDNMCKSQHSAWLLAGVQ